MITKRSPPRKRSWKDRLNTLFPIQGLGWQIIGLAVGLPGIVVALGIGSVASSWFRGASGDFLTAELKVWHLVLAAAGSSVAILALRLGRKRERRAQGVPRPVEVGHLGVLWPVIGIIDLSTTSRLPRSFRAEKPMCPRDRTTLGLAIPDEGEGKDIVMPLGDWWADIAADRMRFGCLKCGGIYDLSKHGCGMRTAREVVGELALGEYRTALAGA